MEFYKRSVWVRPLNLLASWSSLLLVNIGNTR